MGATAIGNEPGEFGAIMRADSEKWGKLIQEARIQGGSDDGRGENRRLRDRCPRSRGSPGRMVVPRRAGLEHRGAGPRRRGASRWSTVGSFNMRKGILEQLAKRGLEAAGT